MAGNENNTGVFGSFTHVLPVNHHSPQSSYYTGLVDTNYLLWHTYRDGCDCDHDL